jgi:hypothetical protein
MQPSGLQVGVCGAFQDERNPEAGVHGLVARGGAAQVDGGGQPGGGRAENVLKQGSSAAGRLAVDDGLGGQLIDAHRGPPGPGVVGADDDH